MTSPDETEALVREVRIAARRETVFAFFTDLEKLVRWKATSAELEPRPGGLYRANINGTSIARGEYLEVVPFTRIVFTWGWEGDARPLPPGSTTVEVSFSADCEATVDFAILGCRPTNGMPTLKDGTTICRDSLWRWKDATLAPIPIAISRWALSPRFRRAGRIFP